MEHNRSMSIINVRQDMMWKKKIEETSYRNKKKIESPLFELHKTDTS